MEDTIWSLGFTLKSFWGGSVEGGRYNKIGKIEVIKFR